MTYSDDSASSVCGGCLGCLFVLSCRMSCRCPQTPHPPKNPRIPPPGIHSGLRLNCQPTQAPNSPVEIATRKTVRLRRRPAARDCSSCRAPQWGQVTNASPIGLPQRLHDVWLTANHLRGSQQPNLDESILSAPFYPRSQSDFPKPRPGLDNRDTTRFISWPFSK
jgi:hypothetical protein